MNLLNNESGGHLIKDFTTESYKRVSDMPHVARSYCERLASNNIETVVHDQLNTTQIRFWVEDFPMTTIADSVATPTAIKNTFGTGFLYKKKKQKIFLPTIFPHDDIIGDHDLTIRGSDYQQKLQNDYKLEALMARNGCFASEVALEKIVRDCPGVVPDTGN